MQVGDVVQGIAAVMDLVVHAEGLGEVRGLHQCRDAALYCNVAAQKISRLQHDPGLVGIEAGDGILGGEDRDRELLLQLDVVVDVLVGERILVPVVVHFLDGAADAHRRRIVVAPGRIEHDRVVADGVAHRFADLDVFFPAGRRMDLVGGPAAFLEAHRLLGIFGRRRQHGGARIGRYRFAKGPEQAVDRLAHRFAQQVPERDIDGADGAHTAGALLLPQVLDHGFAVQRVPTHQHRLQVGDEPLPVGRRRIGGRAQEGMPLDPVVGEDAQQPERARAREAAVLAVLRGRDVVPGEERQRDVGDFHGVVSHSRRSVP